MRGRAGPRTPDSAACNACQTIMSHTPPVSSDWPLSPQVASYWSKLRGAADWPGLAEGAADWTGPADIIAGQPGPPDSNESQVAEGCSARLSDRCTVGRHIQ